MGAISSPRIILECEKINTPVDLIFLICFLAWQAGKFVSIKILFRKIRKYCSILLPLRVVQRL